MAVSRDAGMSRIDAIPGTHVVAISIDNGPALILHPHTARELLQAQEALSSRAKTEVRPGEVFVPAMLRAAPWILSGPRSRERHYAGAFCFCGAQHPKATSCSSRRSAGTSGIL